MLDLEHRHIGALDDIALPAPAITRRDSCARRAQLVQRAMHMADEAAIADRDKAAPPPAAVPGGPTAARPARAWVIASAAEAASPGSDSLERLSRRARAAFSPSRSLARSRGPPRPTDSRARRAADVGRAAQRLAQSARSSLSLGEECHQIEAGVDRLRRRSTAPPDRAASSARAGAGDGAVDQRRAGCPALAGQGLREFQIAPRSPVDRHAVARARPRAGGTRRGSLPFWVSSR